ncbi:hypothetical protein TNCV_511621 [Trichonephila clavipes]|nr:hypothetical protein TNCV_511621 [Trichonephila clavipes]
MDSATLEEPGEEGMETTDDLPQTQEEVPVATKKPRIPPFFVSPKGDWRQLVALAKLIAPPSNPKRQEGSLRSLWPTMSTTGPLANGCNLPGSSSKASC